MSSMTIYDIYVTYKDKRIVADASGPYFGSYLHMDDAMKKALEYEKDPNVFMSSIKTSSVMA